MKKLLSFFIIAPTLIIGTSNVVSCFNKVPIAKVPDVIAKINKANNLNYTDDTIAQTGSDYSLDLTNKKTQTSLFDAIGLTLIERKIVFAVTNTGSKNCMLDSKSEKIDFLVKPNKNYPANGVSAQHTQINITWNKTSKSHDELVQDIKDKITNSPKLIVRGVNLLPDISSSITKSMLFLKLNITKEEEPLITLKGILIPDEKAIISYEIDNKPEDTLTNQVTWFKKVPSLNKDSDATIEIDYQNKDYIFASLDDGIYRSTDDGISFEKLLSINLKTLNQEVWGLFNCDNNLYMSFQHHGALYLPKDHLGDNPEEAATALIPINLLSSKRVTVIYQDTIGNIYYSCINNGLYVQKKDKPISEIVKIDYFGTKTIDALVEEDNELFISTTNSIYESDSLDKSTFSPIEENISSDEEGIYLVKNSYGKVYASTSKGILIYDNETRKFESYDNKLPSNLRATYMAYYGNIFYVETNEPGKTLYGIYSSYDGGATFRKNDYFDHEIEHSFCPLDNNNLMLLCFYAAIGLYYYYEYIS